MWGEVEAGGSINDLPLGDGEIGEDGEAGQVDLTGKVDRYLIDPHRGNSGNRFMIIVISTADFCYHGCCLTSFMASSSTLDAMARISDEGLKAREVAEVSRFITAFKGFGLAELRHASCE